MKYHGEIMEQGDIIYQRNFTATQPIQVIRRMIREILSTGSKPEMLTMYVMNEEGQLWKYQVVYRNGRYFANLRAKSSNFLPKDLVFEVFAGNITIPEVA